MFKRKLIMTRRYYMPWRISIQNTKELDMKNVQRCCWLAPNPWSDGKWIILNINKGMVEDIYSIPLKFLLFAYDVRTKVTVWVFLQLAELGVFLAENVRFVLRHLWERQELSVILIHLRMLHIYRASFSTKLPYQKSKKAKWKFPSPKWDMVLVAIRKYCKTVRFVLKKHCSF